MVERPSRAIVFADQISLLVGGLVAFFGVCVCVLFLVFSFVDLTDFRTETRSLSMSSYHQQTHCLLCSALIV